MLLSLVELNRDKETTYDGFKGNSTTSPIYETYNLGT